MASIFGQRGRYIDPKVLFPIPEDTGILGPVPPAVPQREAPAPAPTPAPQRKPASGIFGRAYQQPSIWNSIGATLQDVSAGLDRREGGNVDRLMAKNKAEQDDAAYRDLIGGMEMDDPLEQMLAVRNPDNYLATKFGDKLKTKGYERELGDRRTDAETEAARRAEEAAAKHGYDVDLEDIKAKRPRYDNTGQAIVRTDPVTGKAEAIYTDPTTGRAAPKTFRAMTPAEVKARGWPDGSTGQVDSTGRAYQDKMTKPQSQFSQTEIRGFRGQADGLMVLGNAVRQYMDVLDEVKPKLIADPWDKAGVQKLKAAHGLITSAIKDADKLGALDQGVQNLVNSIIDDPVGLGTFGKDADTMKAGAQQVYDSIDYKLSRIPEMYRGGATGVTSMAWRVPPEVKKAQAFLQNYDKLPAIFKKPAYKAAAEKVIKDFGDRDKPPKPSTDVDPTDEEYDANMNSFADIDLATAPEGFDQADWDFLTDEEKQQFMSGGQ